MESPSHLLLLKIILFSIFFLFTQSILLGQGETNVWLFGNSIGLDFNNNTNANPDIITDSGMSTDFGSASISDKNGNLLFYSDGKTIYNADHNVMMNGTSLDGVNNTAQSALIIPNPGNPNLFYVFTVDKNNGMHGLKWSEVDMTFDNGLGKVISKNNLLLQPACQKITTVLHSNGHDIWIIGHEWDSNAFYAWLVDDTSISDTPIISNTGELLQYTNDRGHLKSNLAGDKIAFTYGGTACVQLFDFNPTTGIINNPISINGFGVYGVNGLEFSPNDRYLYVGDGFANSTNLPTHELHQLDLSNYNQSSIQNSKIVIYSGSYQQFKALQLAPDGKIYVANRTSFIGAINAPDLRGAACQYSFNQIQFPSEGSKQGLPNFPSFFLANTTFATNHLCFGDTVHFNYQPKTITYDSLRWDFGDESSGALNTSILSNPVHFYEMHGNYIVSLKVWKDGDFFEIKSTHRIVNATSNLEDRTFCEGESVEISAFHPDVYFYKWSNGTSDTSITVYSSGVHSIILNFVGCSLVYDTFSVVQHALPEVPLPSDTTLCNTEAFYLTLPDSSAQYLWHDDSFQNSIFVQSSGTYAVTATSSFGCTDSNSFEVEVDSVIFDTNIKQVTCHGDNDGVVTVFSLHGKSPFQYNWSTGATSYFINQIPVGEYSVTVTDDNNCSFQQTVTLDSLEELQAEFVLFPDNTTTTIEDGNILLTPIGGIPPYNYLWNTGATSQSLTGIGEGEYTVTITDHHGCEFSDTVLLESIAVGIEEIQLLEKIQVFPNPANEFLFVKMPNTFHKNLSATLIDLSGQIIFENFSLEKNNTSIDVSSIPNGLYFLKIKIKEEEKFWKVSIINGS